jgi:WD40 repeat protein
MSQSLICPRGHLWTTPDPLGVVVSVCPICGKEGQVLSAEVATPPTLNHLHAEHPTAVVKREKGSDLTVSDGKTLPLNDRKPTADATAPVRDTLRERPAALSSAHLGQTQETLTFLMSAAAPAAPPRPVVPGYEILDELGHGGMGVVYKARQAGLQRLVALKMILGGAHANPGELARFRREAEAVARLDHAGIVRIFEIGQHNGLPFFSLELVAGGTLADKLRGVPQPPREAAGLIEALARAIHFAHQHGIVHRDLKPANVLLTENGQAKITDFGLAKHIDQTTTQTMSGAVLGTPNYMAPEQARGRNQQVSPATDVYALGAILYELLTGRPPFQAATVVDTLVLVMNQEPVPLRQLQSTLPRDLETVCLKCLEKEPRKRYASAEALADDLRRYLEDKPVLARRAGAVERAWRWCRRNPMVASLTAGIGLLLFVIASGASVAALWLNDERNAALSNLDRAVKAEKTAVEAEKEVRDKLWQSYFDQARAMRWSRRAGRRFDSLAALGKAAAIRPSLDLRNEAITCMALVDLRAGPQWEGMPPGTRSLAFAPALDRYARGDEKGRISICRAGDGAELARLQGPGIPVPVVRFSPDGKYVGAKYHQGADVQFWVWDLERKDVILKVPRGISHYAFDFSPDSGTVAAACLPDGVIEIYELSSGSRLRQLPADQPDHSLPAHSLAFDPRGGRIAVSTLLKNIVSIRDVETGAGQTLQHPSPCRGLAWRSDGRMLATACANSHLYVWDLTSIAKPLATMEGHNHVTVLVAFNRLGDLLASTSWDNTVRLWEPLTGKQLISTPGAGADLRFNPDDRKLAFMQDGSKLGYWELAQSAEFRTLFLGAGVKSAFVDFSSDGRLLISAEEKKSRLWDLATGKELGVLPGNAHAALFHPDGKTIFTCGGAGLNRWPIDVQGHTLSVGPQQTLRCQKNTLGLASLSRDGSFLACQDGAHAIGIKLKDPEATIYYGGHANPRFIAVSPCGKFVATGTWHGTGVKVWDAAKGSVVQELPARASATVAFSPDGRWLVTSTGEDFQFWDTATWKARHRVLRDRGGDIPGYMAFSPKGDLIAVAHSLSVVKLLDPATGKEIATLEPPNPLNLSWLRFSADGSTLAAAAENFIYLWDLRRIRLRLADMKLDWDLPAYPAAPLWSADSPIHVDVRS